LTVVDDIIAIDQHLSSYCHTIDRFVYDSYADHFTPDGVLEVVWQDDQGTLHKVNSGAGCRLTGREQICAFVSRNFDRHPAVPRRRTGPGHELVSRLITVEGDSALLRAVHISGEFQYEIDVTRLPEGWRFARILIIYGHDEPMPATDDGPLPG
jgi:hypothetical protein